VWQEIEALVRHARDRLFVDGYMTPVGMDAIYDDTGEETIEHLIGCTVLSKNDDGVAAHEDVYYPERWLEREQEERKRREQLQQK
jgi:hypothetical protein